MEHLDTSNAVALFDIDSCVYRAGFAAESKSYHVYKNDKLVQVVKTLTEANEVAKEIGFDAVNIEHLLDVEPVENALGNIKSLINRTMDKFSCPWELYLTGSGNFRYELAKTAPYKGNRALMLKPVHYDALRAYAHKRYGAVFVDGKEADDEIATRHTELKKEGRTPIVVSIDKDFLQLEGWNYNWVKDELVYVDELEAHRNYYMQVLTGDRTDNIKGLHGVGPKTAEKMLKDCKSEKEMLRIVTSAYKEANEVDRLPETGTLLWLQRTRELKTWGNYAS